MLRRKEAGIDVTPNEIVNIGSSNLLSPSLFLPTPTTDSYEVKFLIQPALVETVRAWAHKHLMIDPHADASLIDAYHIRSVYLDTAGLDVYHRAASYRRRKYRIRRYGNEQGVYLERKTKSADRVSKRRMLICAEEVARLRESAVDPAWSAEWFHRRLVARQLQPRCVIGYDRIAYVGGNSDGPMRLTLDRHIECALTNTMEVALGERTLSLLPDQVVLELKFRAAMPTLFKDLVGEMALRPASVSKYRLAIEASGVKEAG